MDGMIMTPFEKNLEVWRQLWRVVERSDFIVQVVDARDPLFYRSEDLEDYAKCASSLLVITCEGPEPSHAVRSAWRAACAAKRVCSAAMHAAVASHTCGNQAAR